MKKCTFIGLVLVFFVTLLQPALADDARFVSKKSPYSVSQTLDRLENIVKAKGVTVFTRVDHGAGAKRVGQKLHTSQLLIFGNPKTGSPLMREAPMMGLELPMKALAWKDARGQVWLSYLKPAVLQHRYHLKNDAIIKKLTGALDNFTSQAVAKP